MPSGVYVRTEEGLRNMSIAHQGNTHSQEIIEKIRAGNLGKKLGPPSDEHKQRNRAAKLGDRNPNWKGGISDEEYPPEFNEAKRRVRKRDGYVCQCCDKTEEENGRKLSVHHVDYNKQNCADSNLITLCQRCNSKANGSAVNRYVYMRVFQQKNCLGEIR